MTTATATIASSYLQLIPQAAPGPTHPSVAVHLFRLGEAVDRLAHIDPFVLDAADSITIARAVEQVARAAEAALIRCVQMWNERADPVQTPNTTEEERTWRAADAARRVLVVDLGHSHREAGRLIATAKALRRDTPTEKVLRAGELSAPQARLIAETVSHFAAHHPPEVVDSMRHTLISRAQADGSEGLRRSSEDVAHRSSPTGVLNRARSAEAKRGFYLRPVLDGYVPGGFIPTTGAETLLAALDALADQPSPGEEHGQARVRADALVRLAEDRIRSGELPERHNSPTAVTIVMRADTALGLPDAPPAVTGYGQALPAAEAHMLVCESALRAVLVDGEGEILWQGRRRRLATRAQYEALAVRDGGCTAPSCGRPARECDAHHLVPWAEGGHTDVDQMRLLCRRHHREVHDELWQRQYGWQEAEIRAHNEKRKFTRPRRPWYTDTPAWYPGPSPWLPDGSAEETPAGPLPDLLPVRKVSDEQGKEAPDPAKEYPAAA